MRSEVNKNHSVRLTDNEKQALINWIEKLEPEDKELLKIYAKIKTFERSMTK